jgi:hypothetical protein
MAALDAALAGNEAPRVMNPPGMNRLARPRASESVLLGADWTIAAMQLTDECRPFLGEASPQRRAAFGG